MDPKGTHLPPTPTATVTAATCRTESLPQQKSPTIAILHSTNNTIPETQRLHPLTQTEKAHRPSTNNTQHKSATTQSHFDLATATRATTHNMPTTTSAPLPSATQRSHQQRPATPTTPHAIDTTHPSLPPSPPRRSHRRQPLTLTINTNILTCDPLCVELSGLTLRRKGARLMLGPPSPEKGNWVGVSSPDAPMVWRSQFPPLLQKSVWYVLTPGSIRDNRISLFWRMGIKGCPPKWWLGWLKKFMQNARMQKLVSLVELLHWRREEKTERGKPTWSSWAVGGGGGGMLYFASFLLTHLRYQYPCYFCSAFCSLWVLVYSLRSCGHTW